MFVFTEGLHPPSHCCEVWQHQDSQAAAGEGSQP